MAGYYLGQELASLSSLTDVLFRFHGCSRDSPVMLIDGFRRWLRGRGRKLGSNLAGMTIFSQEGVSYEQNGPLLSNHLDT